MDGCRERWPSSADDLTRLQEQLGARAIRVLTEDRWHSDVQHDQPLFGGCFIAVDRGEAGPGAPGDRAWAAAVSWRPQSHDQPRDSGRMLRGASAHGAPRRAHDIEEQRVAAGLTPASYVPGLLARREGPLLASALESLEVEPDVVLVDATGLDHPRRAGLAVHLGAVTGIPTVGVTSRALVATGSRPRLERGATSPLVLDGEVVGYSVCTRPGAAPVLAHAGWRVDPETAVSVVLRASTPSARTPVPLQEARRVAREARALAGAG